MLESSAIRLRFSSVFHVLLVHFPRQMALLIALSAILDFISLLRRSVFVLAAILVDLLILLLLRFVRIAARDYFLLSPQVRIVRFVQPVRSVSDRQIFSAIPALLVQSLILPVSASALLVLPLLIRIIRRNHFARLVRLVLSFLVRVHRSARIARPVHFLPNILPFNAIFAILESISHSPVSHSAVIVRLVLFPPLKALIFAPPAPLDLLLL